MSATAAQIGRLRRMTGETDSTTYDDETFAEYVERYAMTDARGEEPYTWDTSTDPPTQDDNDRWIPTYDLHAAAADIWEEKASSLSQDYDFSADGATFNRSQSYEQAMKQARFHRSRRMARTLTQRPEPIRSSDVLWVGNLAEVDD